MAGFDLYASSKALLKQFSLSLAEEYWNKLDILYVELGIVKTKLSTAFDPTVWHAISVEDFRKASLTSLGKSQFTHGHWKHALFVLWLTFRGVFCREGSYKYLWINGKRQTTIEFMTEYFTNAKKEAEEKAKKE